MIYVIAGHVLLLAIATWLCHDSIEAAYKNLLQLYEGGVKLSEDATIVVIKVIVKSEVYGKISLVLIGIGGGLLLSKLLSLWFY